MPVALGSIMLTRSIIGLVLLTLCLSDTLAQRQPKAAGPFADFEKAQPLVGDLAPRLHLKDTEGKEMDLRDYLGSWVVMEFGSYT